MTIEVAFTFCKIVVVKQGIGREFYKLNVLEKKLLE